MRAYYSEKLDGKKHDRQGFSCGVPELDRYLREQATQDHRRRVAVPHVLVEAATGRVVGYYTLSMRSIDRDSLPADVARKLPYRQIPVVLIGRLALDTAYQGKGLARRLLSDALLRAVKSGEEIAAYAVVVEARDEVARSFYQHVGFLPMADDPRMLYVPMASIVGLPAG